MSMLPRFRCGIPCLSGLAAFSLLFVVAGCGGGGGAAAGVSASPTPAPVATATPSPTPSPTPTAAPTPSPSPTAAPSPTVTLTSASQDLLVGQTAVLQWAAQNATALVSSSFGAVGLTGSATVSPQATTTYSLTVSGASGQTATGNVTVRVDTVAVTASPSPAAVDVSQSLPFTATVTGAVDTSVTWSVVEANGGTITAAGVYTAPAIGGDYHIVATSNAVPLQSATVPVHVAAASGGVTIN